MMIAYPEADICFEICEDKIPTFVIENQHMFYNMISDICSQLDGNKGEVVLSEDHIPLDMRKTADLLTQFVPFTVNQKELVTKLYAVLKKKAVDEKMYQYTQEILCIESAYHPRLINEEVIIIDKDMCVI